MVVPTTTLTKIRTSALAEFDDLTHMGFGSDNTTPTVSDTTLGSEQERNAFDETPIKSTGSGTYDFLATLGLTEANSTTIQEVGLFTASSGGTMRSRELLTTAVSKTSSIDLTVGMRLTITVVNI